MKFTIHHYSTISSTNIIAREHIQAGLGDEGTVFIADEQTEGYGRRGGKWISPPGNFYCSVILQPKQSIENFNQLAFLTALAVQQTIFHINSLIEIKLKWPNDIMLNGKKVGGILIEIEKNLAVIGIGLNINNLPGEEDNYAALNNNSEVKIEIEDVLKIFLKNLWVIYHQWEQEGFEPIQNAWNMHAYQLNENVTLANKTGIFKGINNKGEVIIIK